MERQMLIAGDWAVALNNMDALKDVVQQLFPCVTAGLQLTLRDIARLTTLAPAVAKDQWLGLSGHLWAHLLLAGVVKPVGLQS